MKRELLFLCLDKQTLNATKNEPEALADLRAKSNEPEALADLNRRSASVSGSCTGNYLDRNEYAPSRRGTVVLGALVCVVLATSLVAASLAAVGQARRECKLPMQVRQTQLLVQAGAERAVKNLQSSKDYRGEQWRPELGLEPNRRAVVDIKFKPHRDVDFGSSSNESSPTAIGIATVTARIESTADSQQGTQRSIRFNVFVNSNKNSEF